MQILISDEIQNIDNLECRNWRDPFSFWGKWCKLVYGRNRLELRAKLMNLWRNNRYNIQSQVKKIFHVNTLTLAISIPISNLPHKFSSQFEIISSSEESKKLQYQKMNPKLRAGDFIRKLREGIVGRIKAFCFAFEPSSARVIKREKTKKMKSDDLIEEIWERRKRREVTLNPEKVYLVI